MTRSGSHTPLRASGHGERTRPPVVEEGLTGGRVPPGHMAPGWESLSSGSIHGILGLSACQTNVNGQDCPLNPACPSEGGQHVKQAKLQEAPADTPRCVETMAGTLCHSNLVPQLHKGLTLVPLAGRGPPLSLNRPHRAWPGGESRKQPEQVAHPLTPLGGIWLLRPRGKCERSVSCR